jgi:hypothetical protein
MFRFPFGCPVTSTKEQAKVQFPNVKSEMGICLGAYAENDKSILLYIPAMRSISASDISTPDKAVAVAIAFLIAAAPILVIYVFAVGFPRIATPPLKKLRGSIDRHQRTIGIVIEVIFGAYLMFKAFR